MNNLSRPMQSEATIINQGMPPLDTLGRATAYFEFWPAWLIYIPVVAYWLWLSLRYRSFGLPMLVNPKIDLGGMVGESKQAIFDLAGEYAQGWLLPFISLQRGDSANLEQQVDTALAGLEQAGLTFPVVAKPDLGCRGVGVRLIHKREDLLRYLEEFPQGRDYLLQQKAPYEAEAGIFYVRYPNQTKGKLTSLALKYSPYVVGDGRATLAELIYADPRASKLAKVYLERHRHKRDWIPTEGEAVRLAFAGSHSRGSIFRNGNIYITQSLEACLDEILKDIPDFHYGRLDVKFRDIDSLAEGKAFKIIEINGVSSEAAHIWDRNTTLREVFSTLFGQYRTLFAMGDIIRRRGHSVPSAFYMIKVWLRELRGARSYPSTD